MYLEIFSKRFMIFLKVFEGNPICVLPSLGFLFLHELVHTADRSANAVSAPLQE